METPMRFGLMLAVAGWTLATSAAHATEHCKALSRTPGGDVITSVALDLDGAGRLDPHALPEGTNAILCRRAAIVPRPEDARVPSELGVAFVVAEGERALWIRPRGGRLKASVEGGELSPEEAAAVDAWLKAAQAGFARPAWR
jgi:hypothetical protein